MTAFDADILLASLKGTSDEGQSQLQFNDMPFSRALEWAFAQNDNFFGQTKVHVFSILNGVGGNRTQTSNLVDLKGRIALAKVVASVASIYASEKKLEENYSDYKKVYLSTILWDELWLLLSDANKDLLRPKMKKNWKDNHQEELSATHEGQLWAAELSAFKSSKMSQERVMHNALASCSFDEIKMLANQSLALMQGIYDKALEYGAKDVFANNIRHLATDTPNTSRPWVQHIEQAHEVLALALLWPNVVSGNNSVFNNFTAEPDNYNNSVSLVNQWEILSGWPSEALSSLLSESWLTDWKLLEEGNSFEFLDVMKGFKPDQINILKYDVDGEAISRHLLQYAFVEPSSPSCTLEDFAFMGGDLDNILRTLKSSMPHRILLVGDHGSGKSELLGALASHLKMRLLNALSPTPQDPVVKAGRVAKNVSVLHDNIKLLSGSIIAIDSMDHLLDANGKAHLEAFVNNKTNRQDMKTHEVWSITTLDDISEVLLNGFDMVVRLGTMPLVARQQLAARFVGGDMARRIAQITTTPGEVKAAAQWVQSTATTEWTDVASFIHGIKEARMSLQKEHEGLPLQVFSASHLNAGFADVVGDDGCVKKARQIIKALQDPQKFEKMGGQMPKGVLLKGQPGTGKTHLARAMAVEAGVPFLLADSAAMARNAQLIAGVFAEARRQAPCILFLDELDAIGTEAKGAMGASPDPARQGILNRLLMELDGVEALDGVLVVGATHRSELLDPALVRSGRLGWHIPLTMPDTRARLALWNHYAKNVACHQDIDWLRIARISTGLSPADISQAMNTSVLLAMHDDDELVHHKHVMLAIDEVLLEGGSMDLYTIEEEKRRTAIHEAGHAMLAWHFGVEMVKATVRPTVGTLGHVRMISEDGRHSMSREMILANIIISFGGLAAEQAHYGSYGTGASMDLNAIRAYAQWLVRKEGMHPKLPGGLSTCIFDRPSEEMKFKAEELEFEWIGELRAKTIEWMETNKDHLKCLADKLYEQSEMDGIEIDAHLNTHWPEGRNMLPSSNPMIAHAAQNLFKGLSKA